MVFSLLTAGGGDDDDDDDGGVFGEGGLHARGWGHQRRQPPAQPKRVAARRSKRAARQRELRPANKKRFVSSKLFCNKSNPSKRPQQPSAP